MAAHIVTAAVVKVSIGSPAGNRVARILRRGSVVPEGVDEAQLGRLIERGLVGAADFDIEVADDAEADTTPAGTDEGNGDTAPAAPADVPNGDPGKSWTHAQIDAWAAAQTPPVVLDADASIAGKLEAIAAVKAG